MTRKTKAVTAALLWSAILAGCGSSSGGGTTTAGTSACPVSGSASSNGSGTLKMGHKGFAEEQLLASMAKQLLEKHGFTVDNSFQAKDPDLETAITGTTIDMYWQYTGTELQKPAIGVVNPPTDLKQAFQLIKSKDETRGICWLDEADLNDTNGLAIRAQDKGLYGTTLSAFSTYLKSHNDVVICVASEFQTRQDGIPGLKRVYGINDTYPGYQTSSQGTYEDKIAATPQQCDAGEVYTTDSAIAAKNLYVLQDDKKLFPPDNVGLLVRSPVLKLHPEIGPIVQPLADKLTTDIMTSLNKKVEVDGLKVDDVALKFLTDNSLI
jgi:osmoprotectant transport system substrate-binding protein